MKQEQNDLSLDQVIEQSFDFSGFEEDQKKAMIAETSGMIMETTLLKALADAGEEMQKKFNDFLESEPEEEEMAVFINDNFPNFGELVIGELKNFQASGEVNEEDGHE